MSGAKEEGTLHMLSRTNWIKTREAEATERGTN